VEAVGEVATGVDQLVKIRGVDLGIADGVDGAEHEVVRDDEEEVGALVSGGGGKRMGGTLLHSGEGEGGA
jgi:hypothetical protein